MVCLCWERAETVTDVTGRRALGTGAGWGIGREIVSRLLQRGAEVAALGGVPCAAVSPTDVSDEAEIRARSSR